VRGKEKYKDHVVAIDAERESPMGLFSLLRKYKDQLVLVSLLIKKTDIGSIATWVCFLVPAVPRPVCLLRTKETVLCYY
jgi:hypothetical protein